MKTIVKDSKSSERDISRPALTPEGRENQLINLAMNLAEQRLRDGTATSQEVVHFLRLGSQKGRVEQRLLELEAELTAAKKEALESSQRMEELYSNAIKAFTGYEYSVGSDDDEDVL